ncbi:hypothetical protein ABZX30_21190 [Streptomyces sp. NPDC004542]|uniref:hypothetical protein n=1 Tax=Streptomyces sp. NPDC004542 TaxID=3154281 RepID=UPI0033AC8F1E
MGAFLAVAAGFPTILFTSALVVVVVFWLLAAVGAADAHGFHAPGLHGHGDGAGDVWGMGGVPVTVSFSLLTVTGWFLSLSATVLLAPLTRSALVRAPVSVAVLAGSVLVAWRLTRLLVRPLHRLFPAERGPSRQDFIGLTCTVRTGWVDCRFGQAEVRAADGSSALVQVRQMGGESLTHGSAGLLYSYDEAGEFFWVGSCPPLDTLPDLSEAPPDPAPQGPPG